MIDQQIASDSADLKSLPSELGVDASFEALCIGKGKQDDISVVSLWISHRYNH